MCWISGFLRWETPPSIRKVASPQIFGQEIVDMLNKLIIRQMLLINVGSHEKSVVEHFDEAEREQISIQYCIPGSPWLLQRA
jgi:hypothetical protein